jgi:trans-aconitate methyltransferase
MTEREKYRRMWQFETYRTTAPGEQEAAAFVDLVRPDSTVIDFGCGTGRGSLAIQRLSGCDVILVDFAENCRDEAALHLPFLEWDLTHPCPARAHYGYCTDVLEHIPPGDVEAVIRNIMASVGTAFFQISTVPDIMGGLIRQSLHLTVEPHAWWLALFQRLGFDVAYASDQGNASQFVIQKG